jgi:HK97 family phage prohead protease
MTDIRLDGRFTGYASIFGQIDLGNDIVEPGAFSKALQRRGVSGIRMLFQHDPDKPIGVWTDIAEDASGLFVTGQITTSVTKGREVLELLRAGAVDGLSIGFRTIRSQPDRKSGARRILEADLWEISVVTFPMQPEARINAVKNSAAPGKLPTLREFERWLTWDAGLTRRDARTVIAEGYSQLTCKRDAAVAQGNDLACRMRAAARQLQTHISDRN